MIHRTHLVPLAATTLAFSLLGAASAAAAGPAAAEPGRGAQAHSCHGKPATIVGTMGDDTIRGTQGPDVIVARGGNDTVRGLGGNDTICGNVGADDLFGGGGHDVLLGGRDQAPQGGDAYWADFLQGGPGSDLIDPGPRSNHLPDVVAFNKATRGLHVNLAKGVAVGEGRDRIEPGKIAVVGSRYDDVIRGSRRNDVLMGFGGSNRIFGGGGSDEVDGARGWLIQYGYNGFKPGPRKRNLLVGGPGADGLLGNRLDTLRGGAGPDQVDGGRVAHGGPGRDHFLTTIRHDRKQVVNGGAGRDHVEFGTPKGFDLELDTDLRSGWARIVGSGVRFRFVGFEDMWFDTRKERWTAHGTGRAEVFGTNGPLTVHAGGGDDRIDSGRFTDHVDGGAGTDTAYTGGGADTCVDVERIRHDTCGG